MKILTKKTIQISRQTMLRRAFKGQKLESSQSKKVEPKILRMPMKKTRHPWLRSSNSLRPNTMQRARKKRESARRTGSSSEQDVWLRTHLRFCRQFQVFLTLILVRDSVKKRRFEPLILTRFAVFNHS